MEAIFWFQYDDARQLTGLSRPTSSSISATMMRLIGMMLRHTPESVFEEIIMRGFLYRTFRESYGIALSILIVAFVAMLTQWGVMTALTWAFLLLAAVQVILCLLLQGERNLWNCVVCHYVYNATLVGAWLVGMSN